MQVNSTASEAETVVIQKKIQMFRRIIHLRRGHRVALHQDLRVHVHQDLQKGKSEGRRLSQLCLKSISVQRKSCRRFWWMVDHCTKCDPGSTRKGRWFCKNNQLDRRVFGKICGSLACAMGKAGFSSKVSEIMDNLSKQFDAEVWRYGSSSWGLCGLWKGPIWGKHQGYVHESPEV